MCAALAVLVLAGSGWAWATYTSFTSSIATVDIGPPKAPAAPVGAPAAVKKDIDGKDQNILITGNDSRDGATPAELAEMRTQDDGGGINTDTMMILHLPADGTKATVISFPRDTLVQIPGHDPNKLNAAYHDGLNDGHGDPNAGAQLLISTLQNLTGLTVDHYVSIGFLGFLRLSKALDGVSVDLCAAQREVNSGIDLKAGWSTIEGSQALAFVRQRHDVPGGDLGRIKRQQYFLSQAFKKMTSAGTLTNPGRIGGILHAIGSTLIMDRDLAKDPLQLIQRFSDLAAGNVTFATIPNDGSDPDSPVGWVFKSDPNEVRSWAANLVGHPADPALAGAPPAAPGSVTVDVVNATGKQDQAAGNLQRLAQLGFHAGRTDSRDPLPITTVEYPAGQQGAAKAVAAVVPGAQLDMVPAVRRVRVVLGENRRQVTARAAATATRRAPTAAPSSSAGVANAQQITSGCID